MRDVIVIGASAGGVDAMMKLARELPADLPAAVFMIVHLPVKPPSILHEVLGHESHMPVFAAMDGATVRNGIITVAVNNHHLLFRDGCVRLSASPRENRSRPSIDAAFRSAALEFGTRCVGVVLTGSMDDGTVGLWAIKDSGGVTVVQAPEDAAYPSMPRSALAHVAIDHAVPISALPELLARLVREPAADASASSGAVPGSGFRRHAASLFQPSSLLADLDATIDNGLWSVLRSIDERQILLEQLIRDAKISGNEDVAQEYARQAEDARMRGDEIRALVMTPAG